MPEVKPKHIDEGWSGIWLVCHNKKFKNKSFLPNKKQKLYIYIILNPWSVGEEQHIDLTRTVSESTIWHRQILL